MVQKVLLGRHVVPGHRWWPADALIAAGVLLVLVLAPDACAAFGLLFDLILVAGSAVVFRRRGVPTRLVRSATRVAARS